MTRTKSLTLLVLSTLLLTASFSTPWVAYRGYEDTSDDWFGAEETYWMLLAPFQAYERTTVNDETETDNGDYFEPLFEFYADGADAGWTVPLLKGSLIVAAILLAGTVILTGLAFIRNNSTAHSTTLGLIRPIIWLNVLTAGAFLTGAIGFTIQIMRTFELGFAPIPMPGLLAFIVALILLGQARQALLRSDPGVRIISRGNAPAAASRRLSCPRCSTVFEVSRANRMITCPVCAASGPAY